MVVTDIVCNNHEPIPKDTSIGMVEKPVLDDKSDSTVEILVRVYVNDYKIGTPILKLRMVARLVNVPERWIYCQRISCWRGMRQSN